MHRTLSIRLSDEEYEQFQRLCIEARVSLTSATKDALKSHETVLREMAKVRNKREE
jgi:hypothetical protein